MENKIFFIKAVHPGYTKDGKSNVGEMIEICVPDASPDNLVSLAGLKLSYTNSSGNQAVLAEISEDLKAFAAGETIILRLASAPDSELANLTYTKTLAFKGGLTLSMGDEVVDEVCWTGKDGCYKEFKSASPTVLVRDMQTGEFTHVEEYVPHFDENNFVVENEPEEVMPSQCKGLEFSEIMSYYAETQDEQFVEIYNAGSEQILLNGCSLKYKNKTYPLEGIVKPEEYRVRYLTDFSITKNPTNSNVIEMVDVNGEVVEKVEYPNGQKKGASYAWVGYDEDGEEMWRTTYAVTPGEPNNYQEYKTCEAGKVINEATGNCVKVTVVTEKTCAAGQYLNPLTGRCRNIEVAKATTCKDGYYLSEETGRCRKIIENTGTTYALETENYEESSSFVALYAILGVVAVGLIYIIFEFRKEILRLFRKVFR